MLRIETESKEKKLLSMVNNPWMRSEEEEQVFCVCVSDLLLTFFLLILYLPLLLLIIIIPLHIITRISCIIRERAQKAMLRSRERAEKKTEKRNKETRRWLLKYLLH